MQLKVEGRSKINKTVTQPNGSLWFLIGSTALSACGGGGGSTGSSSGSVNNSTLSDTVSGFAFSNQFKSQEAYTDLPYYRVFTEASLTPINSTENNSMGDMRAVGDFNGDGRDDVLYTWNDTKIAPVILSGQQDGSLVNVTTIIGDSEVRHIRNTQVIDLDNDGDLDIVAFTAPHGWYRDTLGPEWDSTEPDVIFYNLGGGTFNAVALANETYNHGGAVGDLNGDGVNEIFSLSEYPGSSPYASEPSYKGLLTLNQEGQYTRNNIELPNTEFANLMTSDMRIADLNGDGYDDLVVTVSPRFVTGDVGSPALSSTVGSIKVGTSDGTLNLSAYTWDTYGEHPMDDQTWSEYVAKNGSSSSYSSGVSNVEVIDINQDGQLDILVGYYVSSGGSWETSGFKVFINDNGSFSDETATLFPDQSSNLSVDEPTSFIYGFHAADINIDGLVDLVLETKSSDRADSYDGVKAHTIFINDGEKFLPVDREQLTHESGAVQTMLRTADINGDNVIDILGTMGRSDYEALVTNLNYEGLIV